jgi:hypothetical protein
MKKILLATVAIIGLVGCTVEDTGSSDSFNNDNSYTPAPEPTKSTDDIYLELLYAEYPGLRSMGRTQLVQFGYNICTEIDNGMTLPQLALMGMEYGVDNEMLGFITGASIGAYCPWNESFFEGY